MLFIRLKENKLLSDKILKHKVFNSTISVLDAIDTGRVAPFLQECSGGTSTYDHLTKVSVFWSPWNEIYGSWSCGCQRNHHNKERPLCVAFFVCFHLCVIVWKWVFCGLEIFIWLKIQCGVYWTFSPPYKSNQNYSYTIVSGLIVYVPLKLIQASSVLENNLFGNALMYC